MGSCLHREDYAMYEQNHAILTNESAMMAHLKMPNPPSAPPPLVEYKHWNTRGIDWISQMMMMPWRKMWMAWNTHPTDSWGVSIDLLPFWCCKMPKGEKFIY